MRVINFILLSLLFCSMAYAGNPFSPSGEKKSILLLNKEKHTGFAADRLTPDTGFSNRNYELYEIEKKLHSGKTLTYTGVAMFAGGMALTFAGVGFTNIANNAYGNAIGATTGAAMCYVIGGSCLLAGIPLGVIGALRWSNGSFEKRMYMQLQGNVGPNGIGAKMTF